MFCNHCANSMCRAHNACVRVGNADSSGEFLGLELNYSELELVGVLQLTTLMPYVSDRILQLLLFQHEMLERKDQPEVSSRNGKGTDDMLMLLEEKFGKNKTSRKEHCRKALSLSPPRWDTAWY